MGLRLWFKSAVQKVKDKISAKLKELPPLSEVIKEHKVYLEALAKVIDNVSAYDPEDIAKLNYVRQAIQAAEFAADASELIPGLDKLDAVRDAVRLAMRAAQKGDDKFDAWWAGIRPFIDTYVHSARETGYFKKKAP